MGLLLGPLLIFWIVMLVQSIRMGWAVAHQMDNDVGLWWVIVAAVIGLIVYVFFGLRQFIRKDSLWAFDIPVFFCASKWVCFAGVVLIALHWQGERLTDHAWPEVVVAVGLWILSAGALLGMGLSEKVMDKYGIRRTY